MQKTNRILALDVFRGLTIAGMIMVNNPGNWSQVYPPLLHADWHGVTPTDWIFPFFLFIVGVAIAIALGRRKEQEVPYSQISRKIISRSLIIFGLGLFLAAFPDFGMDESTPAVVVTAHYILLAITTGLIFVRAYLDQKQFKSPKNAKRRRLLFISAGITALLMVILGFEHYDFSSLRIPGVLQRIALVYAACAFLFLYTTARQQVWIGVGLLLLYYGLMFLVPVPGGVAPNLEAETNLGAWLDRTIFTSDHLWSQAKTWDPEGLLSTIPAIVNGIIGMLCGIWLRKEEKSIYQKISGMMVIGALLLVLAFVWDLSFPFNKKIWSSSFVLYTSGVALLMLGTVYWLVDAKKYDGWIKPFQVYGMNALFAYILSGVLATLLYTISWTNAAGESITLKAWLYDGLFTSWLSPKNASLGFALLNVLVVLAFCWVLYRRKIYIKV